MMKSPHVPQSAIADRLGISQAAVSMALAGNPRISEEMRRQVSEVANELGYRPDPGLRSLARYRKRVRPASFHATLAWIHSMNTADAWKDSAVYGQFHDAAAQRASQLGYNLENFWINPHEISDTRATQILVNRGITGLLLIPHVDVHHHYNLDWDRFSVMRVVDYTNEKPPSHCVATDHHASTQIALDEVLQRGYRRPALVTTRSLEERLLFHPSSAFLGSKHAHYPNWPDVLWADDIDRSRFMAWLDETKPDVLLITYTLGVYDKIIEWAKESGHLIPDELGLCMLCLPDKILAKERIPEISGVDEHWTELAERAVELLVDIVERFETGLPAMPMRHLMKGVWQEGTTVRPRLEN